MTSSPIDNDETLERLGYFRVELCPEALKLLVDEGASLIIKQAGHGSVSSTAPHLHKKLGRLELVERVRGLDDESD